MAILVVCPSCGAPQRVAPSLTRFTCSACQGLAELDPRLVEEHLVVAQLPRPDRALEEARRALSAAWVTEAEFDARPAVQVPVWQIVSSAGEEHVVVAGEPGLPNASLLRLPTAPVLRRDDPRATGFEPLPAPAVDRAAAIDAARASFAEPEAPLASIRLLWVGAIPLHIRTRAGAVDGWAIGGTERVVLPPLPAGAAGSRVAHGRVQALGAYLLACVGWGMAAPFGIGLRALGVAVLLGAALITWRVAGGRS